jgi:hypothetical protein
MPINLEDLFGTAGQDNTAGIQQNIYLVDFADVETHPTFPKIEGATSFEELATVDTDLVLKLTKKAMLIQGTLEKGAATSDSQGEMDGMSYKNALKFQIPGNKAKSDGFARWAKNGSFYLLYFELDGAPRILGHPGYPAKLVSAPGTSGEGTSTMKQRTFTFQSVWSGPAPIFAGKLLVGTVEQTLVYLA